jgi:hypothetical protein
MARQLRQMYAGAYYHVFNIHRNPLEAGLVDSCEKYYWSSYAAYLGLRKKYPWLNTEWVLTQLSNDPNRAKELFKKLHENNTKNTGFDEGFESICGNY